MAGTWTYTNGVYEGQWKDGRKNGQGECNLNTSECIAHFTWRKHSPFLVEDDCHVMKRIE